MTWDLCCLVVVQGKLRVEVDLVPDFPHAKTALITFLEKPIIDFR